MCSPRLPNSRKTKIVPLKRRCRIFHLLSLTFGEPRISKLGLHRQSRNSVSSHKIEIQLKVEKSSKQEETQLQLQQPEQVGLHVSSLRASEVAGRQESENFSFLKECCTGYTCVKTIRGCRFFVTLHCYLRYRKHNPITDSISSNTTACL